MKIAGVAKIYTETHLRLIKQLGIDDVVYYNMHGMPIDFDELSATSRLAANQGLRLTLVEGGPPIDKIVLGKEGRDAQIAQYEHAIINMGRLGIEVLCYNFMPQVCDAAMVVRTSMDFPDRGNALTSSFRLSDFDPSNVPHGESSTTDEQMWDNLEYFLRRIIPVAEAAGVRLAMHPDDPPLSPICGLARILRAPKDFDRLLEFSDSPVNGITFCQGCFAEMGVDLCENIIHFSDRINFVHFRDIIGSPDDFVEVFPDAGKNDMIEVIRTFYNVNYRGFIRVDHVPLLTTEAGPYDGYGMYGHTFVNGYLKGLMEPFFGRPT